VEAGWPVPSPRQRPPGIPTALTALVGRDRDIAEVTRLVADNRLVTLVGSGGVGKTRLAIEEAAWLAPQFADGVNLVDLSEVPDPALLWATVARAVGVEEKADAELAQRLTRVLWPQSRLLVLDNCEQLLAATAAVAMQLLSGCPRLWILATSREGLGVPGEVIWRVPSLTFPWPGHQPSLDETEGFGAMALFAERARAARPGLVIGTADIAPLSSICFRLDGILLALELAAARVSALSVREIADRHRHPVRGKADGDGGGHGICRRIDHRHRATAAVDHVDGPGGGVCRHPFRAGADGDGGGHGVATHCRGGHCARCQRQRGRRDDDGNAPAG
jgi:hypothetical protein